MSIAKKDLNILLDVLRNIQGFDELKARNVGLLSASGTEAFFRGLSSDKQLALLQLAVDAVMGGPWGFSKRCLGEDGKRNLAEEFPGLKPPTWRLLCGCVAYLRKETMRWPFEKNARGNHLRAVFGIDPIPEKEFV
eukprot:Protomagalhaensia_wolfi_Nauph_80__4719@NODE_4894_length_484_cov_4_750562_g3963_i0_p1_GENE_NODE_4894_length_484_cov_4_750562_g3963_i0NODE_4894_length_484_cov_4_750562_g3963_i0_p1_ORF_typecomplete_len136_score28_32_NODE_4894_length_484_cov_4_750562_g3963_i019426